MVKLITLTQGKQALVDDIDYKYLRQWKWCAHKSRGKVYVSRCESRASGSAIVRMHQVIAQRAGLNVDNFVVDHRDGNGLNNQRNNLRQATKAQNQYNRRRNKNNVSGFKGVCRTSDNRKWRAGIQVAGHNVHLGCFDKAVDAAKAYNAAALKYFGEFAYLNPI